ncbi:hypothetical protein F5B21DRAFT_149131 [Xylaria acuta]|nr:hypothetical protein F5B21DRAFT_149131 [Xylaria acuta]
MEEQIPHMLLLSNFPVDESIFGASPNSAAKNILDRTSAILELVRKRNMAAEAAKNPCRNFSSKTGIAGHCLP